MEIFFWGCYQWSQWSHYGVYEVMELVLLPVTDPVTELVFLFVKQQLWLIGPPLSWSKAFGMSFGNANDWLELSWRPQDGLAPRELPQSRGWNLQSYPLQPQGYRLSWSWEWGSRERRVRKGLGTWYTLQRHIPVTTSSYQAPLRSNPCSYEFISGLIHPWGSNPDDLLTSQ
jgi:hypothetical protein